MNLLKCLFVARLYEIKIYTVGGFHYSICYFFILTYQQICCSIHAAYMYRIQIMRLQGKAIIETLYSRNRHRQDQGLSHINYSRRLKVKIFLRGYTTFDSQL